MNEIKRQLKRKIGDTTQYQQHVVQKIQNRNLVQAKKNTIFFPAVVSVVLLVATCLFFFSLKEPAPHTTTLDVVQTPIVKDIENPVEGQIPLTEEQKEQYYAQYVEILDEVESKKFGIGMEVAPMDTFEESDWIEPQAFERRIQEGVESFLEREREKLANVSWDLKPAVMNPDGTTTKARYLYFSDIVKKIEVTAMFDTRYDAAKERQLFSGVADISAEMIDVQATWEQTFVEATLLDGGRTYSIYMEGVFYLNGSEIKKAFTIEFYCDEFGKIT